MFKIHFKVTLFSLLLLATIIPLRADGDEDHSHNITIKEVLVEIRTEQNVRTNKDIDPDKVSQNLLVKLSEAVMRRV